MQEEKTADYIATILKELRYDVETGVGEHGVVGSLTAGDGEQTLGLRADFDALPIQEINALPYTSRVPGVSHLCGHDAHASMLLGAAKYLAQKRSFNGTVRMIFQPGEETMQGGPAMIKDGLFERFPVDAVFGMHNMPGLSRASFTLPPVPPWLP